jgi:hypothetical protein
MRSYYQMTTQIRPGWRLAHPSSLKIQNGVFSGWLSSRAVDERAWRDAPHVTLANLGYKPANPKLVASEAEVKKFVLEYGPLGVGLMDTGGSESETPFDFPIFVFRWHQQQLRDAWERRDATLFTDPGNFIEGLGFDYVPMNWHVTKKGVELQPANCLTYMSILLIRDIASGNARICPNPTCPAPYFIAPRTNRKFCSAACRNVVGQRNFKKRWQRRRKR